MQNLSKFFTVPLLILFFTGNIHSQSSTPFDIQAYKQFLGTHQNMDADQLRTMYPAGKFEKNVHTNFNTAVFSDSIQKKYSLTEYERTLIEAHGFMVSERLKRQSFGAALDEIFTYDLPVFVSSDAVLHAVHMSYDAMLKQVEQYMLGQKLDSLLEALHHQLPALAVRYNGYPAMKQMLMDVDLYITVPRKLLGRTISPVFPEMTSTVDSMLNFIAAAQPKSYALFSSTERVIDFSQFTVRGHYTQSEYLKRYFQAMMWIGRTEMYLIAPVNSFPQQKEVDIQRQIIDALLIAESANRSNANTLLEEMDTILRLFVGESDNVTLPNLQSLKAAN